MTTSTPATAGTTDRTGKRILPVTVSNFVRAETDVYFGVAARKGAFGRLKHNRQMISIDRQDVVRMNRDTIYSSGVFDLDAAPVSIALPEPGKRFMSMQVISEDHYTLEVGYAPGRFTCTKQKVDTRYVLIAIRTLANPQDPADMAAANRLQDAIEVEQTRPGTFDVPAWDPESQAEVREALNVLARNMGRRSGEMFGAREKVDPVLHLIGSAAGWGGNPTGAAVYNIVFPRDNDGSTVHQLTVRDVPVDGFWSVTVYNAGGYFEKNPLDAYSINNLIAKPNADGSFTIQFGGCQKRTPNCLPIMPGWNYTVRLYRPRRELLDGTWTFPEATPVK